MCCTTAVVATWLDEQKMMIYHHSAWAYILYVHVGLMSSLSLQTVATNSIQQCEKHTNECIRTQRLLFIIVVGLLGRRANPFSWWSERQRETSCVLPVLRAHWSLGDTTPDTVSTRGLMSLGAFPVTHNIFTAHIKLHTQWRQEYTTPLRQLSCNMKLSHFIIRTKVFWRSTRNTK